MTIASSEHLLRPNPIHDRAPSRVRFCTWNTDDCFNRAGVESEKRIQLLAELDADVVALQEVRGYRTDRFASGPSVFTNAFFPDRNTSQWMIAGLTFREGTTIEDHGMVPLPERPQRGVWARVILPDWSDPITFVSWHSPHGVNVPAAYKVSFFGAMEGWLAAQSGPLVLGADINTWTDPVDLRPADGIDPYSLEHAFVGLEPRHGLRDAYRLTLEESGRLAEIREASPEGPLAISHSATPTRRDRILISSEFDAVESAYETELGFALSDHAPHWADLELRHAGSLLRG
ncbi:MAG: endonuclease/exonuclease/phosphatase family protein [Solirubrobacterales bacterium]